MRSIPILIATAGLLALSASAFANAPATGAPAASDYVCKQAMQQEQRDLMREAAHGHLAALRVVGPKLCTSDKMSQGGRGNHERRDVDQNQPG